MSSTLLRPLLLFWEHLLFSSPCACVELAAVESADEAVVADGLDSDGLDLLADEADASGASEVRARKSSETREETCGLVALKADDVGFGTTEAAVSDCRFVEAEDADAAGATAGVLPLCLNAAKRAAARSRLKVTVVAVILLGTVSIGADWPKRVRLALDGVPSTKSSLSSPESEDCPSLARFLFVLKIK